MEAKTHAIIAVSCVTVGNIITGSSPDLGTLFVAAFTSLLPDVDRPHSRISRICPPLSRYLYQTVGHRTLTHSIFGWLIFAFLCYPLKFVPIDANLYSAALIGYISHALLDTLNLEGVRLTYPLLAHHCYVLPANAEIRIKAQSPKEKTMRVICGLICIGLLGVNMLGARTMFRNLLGTPQAIARDYAHQLKLGFRPVVKIQGVWTNGQNRVDAIFDVIGATDWAIFVRKPSNPEKVYQIGGNFSAISHARLKIVKRVQAEQRVVRVKFNSELWKGDLLNQYPNGIVSGRIRTKARPPKFGLDEFATVKRNGDDWIITQAPIHLIHQVLSQSSARITGEVQIRYWRERANGHDGNNRRKS